MEVFLIKVITGSLEAKEQGLIRKFKLLFY